MGYYYKNLKESQPLSLSTFFVIVSVVLMIIYLIFDLIFLTHPFEINLTKRDFDVIILALLLVFSILLGFQVYIILMLKNERIVINSITCSSLFISISFFLLVLYNNSYVFLLEIIYFIVMLGIIKIYRIKSQDDLWALFFSFIVNIIILILFIVGSISINHIMCISTVLVMLNIYVVLLYKKFQKHNNLICIITRIVFTLVYICSVILVLKKYNKFVYDYAKDLLVNVLEQFGLSGYSKKINMEAAQMYFLVLLSWLFSHYTNKNFYILLFGNQNVHSAVKINNVTLSLFMLYFFLCISLFVVVENDKYINNFINSITLVSILMIIKSASEDKY